MSNEIKPVAWMCVEKGGKICDATNNSRSRDSYALCGRDIINLYDQSAIDCLTAQRDGWIEQHNRDSVQLRALCSERDVAWLQCKELAAQLAEYKADAERSYYWKQRAKSAEGHLWASDGVAAAQAVHTYSALSDIPWDSLAEKDRWGFEMVACRAIAAVNAKRDARKPANSICAEDK